MELILHDYWRSSAAYRVRIALNLAALNYERSVVDLLNADHKDESFIALNPQGLVPALSIDGHVLSQSLAIIEYLSETRNLGLIPDHPMERWRVRAISYCIAMEIHPICNLSVSQLVHELSERKISIKEWMHEFIPKGLAAVERYLGHSETGKYCHGDSVTMADVCLVPQVYNAKRWDISLTKYPIISQITSRLEKLDEFQRAHPNNFKPKEI